MSKDVRKALMIAKGPVSSGYLPPGDPQREANLARHMEGSAAPPVMYHGTTRIKSWRSDPKAIDKFQGSRGHPRAQVAAYAAFEPEFAARFANYNSMENPEKTLDEQGSVYPLAVRATNVFDIANPEHRKLVNVTKHPAKASEAHYKNLPDNKYPWDWKDLEHNTHKIKKSGFDSFYDYESNVLSKDPPSGIGVFDPAQIKSAVGNNGQYNLNEPDIAKAEGGEVDVQYDNPGGNWLKHEREDAEVVVQKRGNIGASGALTAWSKPVHVDPAKLSKIPGSMNERPEPGTPNYDDLYKSMSAEGYKNNNYVLVGINHRGEPHIIEGNHRAAVARDLGVKSIPAKFHWFAGGEQADGFKPEHIKSLMPDITKAEGGEVKSRHPALSIPGFHVREEIHGTPIFTGGRNAN